ncbi:helix-turn-helix domain-containing protein [Chryseobacterium chendengshani]|uniref:helix-turn-helix domain-containing protein n=1 Tax=Chryseobacterium sp. LJ668 TaxID=2864040 RepID=UPI001C68B1B1|nr:helix-turn-helix domain-containing protein [Chryseobacterium sp. LJ668]MBW8522165.1 helix-turn-helix domain-containing protein [Chryseobacterium sp. LJ668]QYK17811.1 helix-turn-helix domain-containing protein [Chryseobacterium sp. LJ668]
MFSLLLTDEGKELLKSAIREVVQEIMEKTTEVDSQKENFSTCVKSIEDEFLTRKEVSQKLKVSLVTLNNWQKNKILIPLKIGKRILYNAKDVEKAMLKQEVNSKH